MKLTSQGIEVNFIKRGELKAKEVPIGPKKGKRVKMRREKGNGAGKIDEKTER